MVVAGRASAVGKLADALLLIFFTIIQPEASPASAHTAVPPAKVHSPNAPADIDLRAIIEVRKIDSLTLGPDGRSIGFRVISPSIQENRLSARWFKTAVAGDTKPIALGRSQVPQLHPLFDMVTDGAALWDRDGASLFVLEQAGSAIAVHRLGTEGRDQAITHDRADVIDFATPAEGRRLRYRVRADRTAIDQAQSLEEQQGVHFDKTIFADGMRLTRSFGVGDRVVSIRNDGGLYPSQAYAGDLRTRKVTLPLSMSPPVPDGDVADYVGINILQQMLINKASLPSLRISDGTLLWLDPIGGVAPDAMSQSFRLTATLSNGEIRPCAAPECSGPYFALKQVFADPLNGGAVIMRENGVARETHVYVWSPGSETVRQIYAGATSLNGGSATSGAGCILSGRTLLCVESGPVVPPRLVGIDIATGARTLLANPNEGLAARVFPDVKPFSWESGGASSSGILVMPHDATGRLPLVLTTYGCRGFLDGGTGTLTPEFLLAQRGIAALCVNMADDLYSGPRDGSKPEPMRAHKAEIEIYRAAIAALAAKGVIDPERVGISGHSFSAMVTAYAISHTDLFRAASMGTGTLTDPVSFYVRAQEPEAEGRSSIAGMGLPAVDDDPGHVWPSVSAALNANRIHAPLLMQPPENEWLAGLQLYTALRDRNRPVDMYVFPNAGHMLERYPMQQYWRARRSVDWFSFWLTGREFADGAPPSQYQAWHVLRAQAAVPPVTATASMLN